MTMQPKTIGSVGLGTTFSQPAVSAPIVHVGSGGKPPAAPVSTGFGGNGGGMGQANPNNAPCPPGCGCHPLWYVGSAVGVMMLLSLLLARK
jgi:hypothetical protein